MEDETVEEFRAKLKKLIDDVNNIKPTQKIPQKFNKQRRMTSQEAKNKSGWRRGLALGGSIR